MTPERIPTVAAPTVEHHREPFGIGESSPRLSWKTTAPVGWTQRAYQIEVIGADGTHRTGRTDWVTSQDSVLVPWPLPLLSSRARCEVRLRVRGADRVTSDWSPPLQIETGLLEPTNWTARAISPHEPHEPHDSERPVAGRRPPLLRREFALGAEVERARLYVTAHGLYEIEINGRRVGDHTLAPGWTSYHHRLRYQTHDVTEHLRVGDNAIGAWLADGWYRGRLGFGGGHADLYGNRVALLAQLEIVHRDGTVTVIGTDPSWRAGQGPILASGLLDGETYDAREELPGWSSPGFDDGDWSPVDVVTRDPATLVAPTGPPVRCTEEIHPVLVTALDGDRLLVDFGQNLVGRIRITVSGPAGHTIVIRHAEVLQDGELCVRPLRGATSTDRYTLRGDGPETWEPRFTIHGFRYAEITGWRGGDPHRDITARVHHTDMARTGWFECSNEQVNRLHRNVVWSLRGNFVDLPTDCPQRDERLGWTGDIQIFAPTAAFLYDCHGMLASWLRDVAVEQHADGTVPWYVPEIPGGEQWTPARPGAGWGDVVALTPWDLYRASGDTGLLAAQYAGARRWVDLVTELADESGLWNRGYQLGDWLDPFAPPEDPGAGRTDRHLIATAYYAWSLRHVAWTAGVLGREDERRRYQLRADRVRQAFVAEYAGPGGLMTSDTQTAYAVALQFDLLPDAAARAAAGRRLADLVAAGGHTIRTGFIGTPLVAPALSATGHDDSAYALLLQQECPSWLYALKHDATTVWERWDSMLPDGTVNPGEMTSFNHYALGAVAQWLHTTVAGLEAGAPGYREVVFRPRPGGGISWASAAHESPYGRVAIRWELGRTELTVETTVPTGTTGRIEWPDGGVTFLPTGTTSTRRHHLASCPEPTH
ncbi:putative exported rhamnosidase A [Streptomyces scabiei 87.22]|uniref:alpha-L-rhamnosidase n=1 Tax=Streptomyces scabiei (strain 87.22) TaxID=680198 RepID=C9Z040_STRSW|nr:alpha-L-rhamnosidase [Streptomyces scabiei]MDX2577041.1 family 78 glycoside hydrolase catalytic domain [Streptomyces scabiei]MDX2652808.1 family 78 glycoside hydrolase catalytic domain [Streptomyces scabiei]MDX2722034.1 family 78 glycoside hydrolase catalytic domain [Streptomyces scabiei]MDX2864382.1 family 78 glycoside hydrolase catalytic domain [Streptomyces scabiei]MDX2883122.1 family 78 glycoside hydrolase catalytic domain [Streptomyces scabiei]